MHPLAAADLLDLWERGGTLHPVERDLLVLAAASPDETMARLATLSIGQRDARLLALREQTFGPRLAGFARCPACGSPLEFNLLVADLAAAAASSSSDGEWWVQADGFEVQFRLPNSLDLLEVAAVARTADAGRRLLERCILHARADGTPVAPEDVPPEVRRVIAQQMAECDPLAEVLLDLSCAGCGEQWQQVFDPGAFLWAELAAQARRLIAEVHTLARAYGWREADILAMSSQRRRWYVEMVES